MISLLSNRLSRVTPHTFAFDGESPVQLHIHLWMNEMTEDMFEPGSFANTRRPVHLDVTGNKLRSLPAPVFRDLLANKHSRLSVDGNPLTCDCRLAWLFEADYHERVDGLACIAANKSIKLTKAADLGDCSAVRRAVIRGYDTTFLCVVLGLSATAAGIVVYVVVYRRVTK